MALTVTTRSNDLPFVMPIASYRILLSPALGPFPPKLLCPRFELKKSSKSFSPAQPVEVVVVVVVVKVVLTVVVRVVVVVGVVVVVVVVGTGVVVTVDRVVEVVVVVGSPVVVVVVVVIVFTIPFLQLRRR